MDPVRTGAPQATASPPAASDEAQVGQAIRALWDRFKDVNLNRVTSIEDAAMALLERRLDDDLRATAQREAHKLAGGVGSFGFGRASELAREAEHLLERTTAPVDGLRLAELAVSLRTELNGTPSPIALPATPVIQQPLLLILSTDADWADRLAAEAVAQGLRAETRAPGDADVPALAASAAVALIEIGDGSGASSVSLAQLDQLRAGGDDPVIVAIADSGGFDLRLAAARQGVRTVLTRPVSAPTVISTARQLSEPVAALDASVLALDDDPQVLTVLSTELGGAGFDVTAMSSPWELWSTLERRRPDLLILDLDMPGVSGIDLCRVVRGDPRWSTVPVLFLTANTSQACVDALFAAGADDYVSKPLRAPELLTRVVNRLERIRALRATADRDVLTGLPTHQAAGEHIGRLMHLAERHGQPLSVALLSIDDLQVVNDTAGLSVGDDVLRQLSRRLQLSIGGEDVVTRWRGDQFLVVRYGSTREQTVEHLSALLGEWRRISLPTGSGTTFSAGVAEYGAHGRDLSTLSAAAAGALATARGSHLGRIVAVGRDPTHGPVETYDVAIVDDDESVAALLEQTLRSRGYRTCWLKDGSEAVAALSGPTPTVRARVILLDINLPGTDGMSVLRQLGATGVLHGTRVIMLTLRSSESETHAALARGAFDHMAKPFSVAILLQRVHRALSASSR